MSWTGRHTLVASVLAALGLALVALLASGEPDGPAEPAVDTPAGLEVTVYRSPTCGCCGKWAEHVQAAGFRVREVEVSDLETVKRIQGVPARLASCHTAVVDGYVIEGHVPVADVQRLLRERPAVRGLAVPGMPTGSPGMELPGRPADAYEVLAFDDQGRSRVFSSY
jgi:hypothetical protein